MNALEPSGAAVHADVQPGLHGAFMREGFGVLPLRFEPSGGTPLAGLRLAVKDVYDIEGLVTGGGSPVWRAGRAPAAQTATAVRLLMEAGCGWVGKTLTDELTYSLAGINAHHGTPVNPAAPRHIPGGSSSGSVVAVAAGHADVGLGTDCGGSVRVPASYCGVWGIRPTHGRIATNGCFTLAHSFDTVGWFARDGATLARVFEVMAHTRVPAPGALPPLRVSNDTLAVLDPAVRERFEALCGALGAERLPASRLPLAAWVQAFRALQAAEVWQQHGTWFRAHGATLGVDIGQRFRMASQVGAEDVAAAQGARIAAAATLAGLLGGEGGPARLLLIPTVPTAAPRLDASLEQVDAVRARSQQLLCIAGLAGLPQVSLPWMVEPASGAPVGLSLVGPRGADELVLAAAQALDQALQAA